MKRLICISAFAAVSAWSTSVHAQTCNATITASIKDGKLEIADVDKLTCAPGETINLTFVNNDPMTDHRFQVWAIGCKGNKAGGKNPTVGLRRKPTDVGHGTSTTFNGAVVGSKGYVKNAHCGTAQIMTYQYSYTVRVSDKGSNTGHRVDKDPDLEVSPPPVSVPPVKKR